MIRSLICGLFVLLAYFYCPQQISAQIQGDTATAVFPIAQPFYRYHIAVMGGLVEGDGALGRDGIEGIFGTYFSYSWTTWLESEFAFHYIPAQRIAISGSGFPFISLNSIFDVSLMARPFAGLRIGAGISLRHITAARKVVQGYSVASTGQLQDRYYRVRFDEAPSLAINIKLDYLIPLTSRLDLGIRAQTFLTPYELRLGYVSASDYHLAGTLGGLVSIGAYLRMNW